MTQQSEVIDDPKYISILDHGFCGLIDHMGDDSAITRSARTSYGTGTKKINEDRGLIRYLMRHQHSSPIEFCEFTYHLKVPIFVMRQLIRHRTASTNEYSGRYSVMSDEFYLPQPEDLKQQSLNNKQGRAGDIDPVSKDGVAWIMQSAYDYAYTAYRVLLGDREAVEDHYDPYAKTNPLLSDEFTGISRELARTVLPVANYTECYWKIDLSNLFKLLKLRQDQHAQYEIRVLADAMHELIKPIVPLACEAFRDYMQEATTVSRMELNLLNDALDHIEGYGGLLEDYHHDETALRNHYELTKSELDDFKIKFRRFK